MNLEYLIGLTRKIDWTCLWTFVSAIATVGLFIVAAVQLNKISKIAQADFIHRFTESFFRLECRNLLLLFDYGLLSFKTIKVKDKEIPYFEVDQKMLAEFSCIDQKTKEHLKSTYSEFDVDDCLLGYLEDIGNYRKERLINFRLADQVFGSYIEGLWEDKEVQKYIKWTKKSYGHEIYSGFEGIYNEIQSQKTPGKL